MISGRASDLLDAIGAADLVAARFRANALFWFPTDVELRAWYADMHSLNLQGAAL